MTGNTVAIALCKPMPAGRNKESEGVMLMIRQDQMETLNQYMLDKYEDLVFFHLTENYTDTCAALGEDGVRETIRHGIRRAQSYDIRIEADISRYIDMMFRFGKDFDTDPDLPWAAAILGDENLVAGFEKLDLLEAAAQEYPAPASA